MNIWTILGIGQTDDKDAIKQAYRERLKSVNPEEDADGFMELRNAYEEAIASCDRQEALPEDMDDEASEGLQPPRTELTDNYTTIIRTVSVWMRGESFFVRMHLYRLTQRQKHWRSCLYF